MSISILLTLFFTSLAGIILMIGHKFSLVRHGHIEAIEPLDSLMPDVHKARNIVLRSFKKMIYAVTFVVLHIYVKITTLLKKGYNILKTKVQDMFIRHLENNRESRRDTNKVLKVIADYKRKISIMKSKIHEEEKKL